MPDPCSHDPHMAVLLHSGGLSLTLSRSLEGCLPRYGPLGRFALLVLLGSRGGSSSSSSSSSRVESRFEQLAKVFLLGHYNKV